MDRPIQPTPPATRGLSVYHRKLSLFLCLSFSRLQNLEAVAVRIMNERGSLPLETSSRRSPYAFST